MRAAVVVLGDLGRSPRMLYHTQALAAHGVDVDLTGYVDSALPSSIRDEPRITVHSLRSESGAGPSQLSRRQYLGRAVWRGLATAARLTALLLWRLPRPDAIVVQNPPGIPVLLVAWIACRVRSARFVIDWHNLTYSMLALRLGPSHALVRIARWYEGAVGGLGDLHLFVSHAMQETLGERWHLRGVVFRDRPAESFETVTPVERQQIRRELFARLGVPATVPLDAALAVSPTSWTADEDFDLLLAAVAACERLIRDHEAGGASFPHLLVLLTGRGALRERYEQQMASLTSTRIHLRTAWLESQDYPRVLAAADVGLCFHRSASGLDLPMKVADMFGAGIPVCALNYGPCLSEVVQHRANGLLFSTADELARQLFELFAPSSAASPLLASLAHGVANARSQGWQAAWSREVWPVLSPLLAGRPRA